MDKRKANASAQGSRAMREHDHRPELASSEANRARAAELVVSWREHGRKQDMAELVELSEGLIRKAAYKFRNQLDEGDARQEAILGLMAATAKFDASLGFSFFNFAKWDVYSALQKAAADLGLSGLAGSDSLLSAITRHVIAKDGDVEAGVEAYVAGTKRRIGEQKKKTLVALYQARWGRANTRVCDADGEEVDLLDFLPDGSCEDDRIEAIDLPRRLERFREAYRALEPRLGRIYTMHFFEGRTLEELSKLEGVSRERINQLCTAAHKKVCHAMGWPPGCMDAIRRYPAASRTQLPSMAA